MKFLNSMSHNWNISLFHYRNHGADYGRVLVGMQVPHHDKKALKTFLDTLGYRSGTRATIRRIGCSWDSVH